MAEEQKKSLTRRGAIAGTMLGIGGLFGWAVNKLNETGRGAGVGQNGPKVPVNGKNPFAYDISSYLKTDPETLVFEPAGEFESGFRKVRSIAITPSNELMVTGDKGIRIFGIDGELQQEISLEHTPHNTHIATSGELFVAYARHFDVHDRDGKRLHSTERFSERSFITAMATRDDRVYVADAGNREIILCDRMGAVETRFGKIGHSDDTPGFAVPSPYFDLEIDDQDKLRVTNPGRLRMETYSLDGKFEGSWGEPGMTIERFSGCCNPVHFALTGDGGYITSEKGLTRVKLHDAEGKLLGLVAGPDFLVENPKKVKRAGEAAGAFDIALSEDGQVHVLDPYSAKVRSFQPLS
jgi:hypothetical protein